MVQRKQPPLPHAQSKTSSHRKGALKLPSKLVHLISLGCSRNLVDSEVMIGLLQKHGYGLTNTIGTADVIIINTCGFLEASRNESLEIIRHAIASKKTGAKVIVAGCFSQLQGPALEELRPQIHYFLGSGDIESVLAAVDSTEAGASVTNARSYLEQGDVPRTLSTPSHYAYLKIAEGCRKGCSYCIIPHIKGPLKSKPIDQVVHEFSALLSQGVFEIILIAQDLGDYLQDQGFSGSAGLVQLLQRLLRLPQDFRIRLLYLYPDEIDATLIDMMKSDRRILPYLDMPLFGFLTAANLSIAPGAV